MAALKLTQTRKPHAVAIERRSLPACKADEGGDVADSHSAVVMPRLAMTTQALTAPTQHAAVIVCPLGIPQPR